MSNRRKPQGTELPPFSQKNLRIVSILDVKKKWIETLCTFVHKGHYPSGATPVPLGDAIKEFNKTSFSTGGHSSGDNNSEEADDEEPIDIELFMAQSGTQQDDAFFDIANESRFIALKKLVGVDARCLCVYNLSPVARGEGANRVFVEPNICYVIVSGYFPTLSTACLLDVVGDVAGNEAVAGHPGTVKVVRTTRPECSILPSEAKYARIGDLIAMFQHGPRMANEAIQYRLKELFPAVFKQEEPSRNNANRPPQSFVSYDSLVKLYVDKEVPVDPGLAVREGRVEDVCFEISVLRTAIASYTRMDFGMAALDNERTFFSTAWVFLFGTELNLICKQYATGRRWQEIVVRGSTVISKVFSMLTTEPYLLCFWELKRTEAIDAQKSLKALEDMMRTSGNSTRAMVIRKERASLHCVVTLPELTYAQLRSLQGDAHQRKTKWKLEGLDRQLVIVAVDVYALMKISLQSRDDLIYSPDHKSRLETSVHNSSGHMYTVFDNAPLINLEGYDAAASRGTLTLGPMVEDERAQPEQSNSRVEYVARNPQSVPQQMRPPNSQQARVDDDGEDTFSVPYVPSIRPFQTVQQSDANRAFESQQSRQVTLARNRPPANYLDHVQRLATEGVNAAQMIAALEWLIKYKIATRETMIGTGPINKGEPFDAFYISSVYKLQARSVKIMGDIYARGVRTAVRKPALATKYDVAECQALALVKERMRVFLKSLTYKHIAIINDEREHEKSTFNENDLAAQAKYNETTANLTTGLTAVYDMACLMEKSLDEFLGGAPFKASDSCGKLDDEFSDYTVLLTSAPITQSVADILFEDVTDDIKKFNEGLRARVDNSFKVVSGKGFERRRSFRLLKRDMLESQAGAGMQPESTCAPEQQRAIDGALASPIYIFTGRGGTGKTFGVERFAENLVPCQILFVAPTGRVATELRRRLSKNAGANAPQIEIPEASTIHSVLFRQVMYKKEQSSMQAMLGRLGMLYKDKPVHSKIVNVRRRLFEFCGGFKYSSPYDGKRALVIEEMSLVPFALFAELLASAHPMTSNGNIYLEKILCCGDVSQLPAIGYGVVLRDLCRAFPANIGHLTINHRSVTNPKIFDFATAVSEGKFSSEAMRVMRDFKSDSNTQRLVTSTKIQLTGNETPEEEGRLRAAANDASVCCFASQEKDMGSTMKFVLRSLGALDEPPTARTMAIRNSIVMIAPMAHVVEKANAIVRALYRSDQVRANGGSLRADEKTGDMLLSAEFGRRIMLGDRIAFRKNFQIVYNVPENVSPDGSMQNVLDAFADSDDEEQEEQEQEEPALVATTSSATSMFDETDPDAMHIDPRVESQLPPLAPARVHKPYTPEQLAILQKDAGASVAIGKLTNRAFESGLITAVPTKSVVVQFNNGEPLIVAGVYNRPAKPTAKTSCACGMHPPPVEGEFIQYECVKNPEVVPLLRRVNADSNDRSNLQWHDQSFDYRDKSERICRMLVLASLHYPDLYKEVDIRRRLATQNDWKFVEAETINVLQGSETDIAIILVPKDNAYFGSAAVYTAITRARERVIVIGLPDAFEKMCTRRDVVQSSDFWFKLAHETHKVHVELINAGYSPQRIAASLAVRSTVASRQFQITHAADDSCRPETWRLYNDVKKHAFDLALAEREESL